ncbi:hypothetical protein ASPWEDRAFT_278070 [Aspergillus wentii DTO 134E9]|uniref:Uncharacterized protein n=1 Tax=Aspergillus wentii DTO 134E9 TaxID=1073089 RepID=A0A1L9S397_ASPWE|nr:uncharacterized protein ASPWEDRAFT_278070 [Aspergillus wentii DTO 134E9]OJJ41631.1 hypothetical protein ASPWEDRAFT_278070 [Aspergillus wentii DTO 134E9]
MGHLVFGALLSAHFPGTRVGFTFSNVLWLLVGFREEEEGIYTGCDEGDLGWSSSSSFTSSRVESSQFNSIPFKSSQSSRIFPLSALGRIIHLYTSLCLPASQPYSYSIRISSKCLFSLYQLLLLLVQLLPFNRWFDPSTLTLVLILVLQTPVPDSLPLVLSQTNIPGQRLVRRLWQDGGFAARVGGRITRLWLQSVALSVGIPRTTIAHFFDSTLSVILLFLFFGSSSYSFSCIDGLYV